MRVVLGVGGGEAATVALEQTILRAKEAGDDLTVCVYASDGRSVETVAAWVDERLAAAGIEAPVRRLEAEPAAALVEIAEREGFDQLVIPGGTQSPMGKLTLGPVAEYVLLNAQVSVRLER